MKHTKTTKTAHLSPEMTKEIQRAYQFHLRQLSIKEIAKLMNKTPRTVQRWKTDFDFEGLAAIPANRPPETIPQKALKMANSGFSYSQIAKQLKRCKATIYNYVKAERAKPKPEHSGTLQPLFNYLHELGIIAIETEMITIIEIVEQIQKQKDT